MKKLKNLLSLSILFFALYSCNEQLEVQGVELLDTIDSNSAIQKEYIPSASEIDVFCGKPVECKLIAGQHINAGLVTIRNDEDTLYVTVFSKVGFQDVGENIKMWVGTDLPDKRPPAGKFPYKWTESGKSHTFEVPLSSIDGWEVSCGENAKPFYIIVHADVLTESGSKETAFGGCIEGPGKAWWYYMEYIPSCCEEWSPNAFGVKHDNIQSLCNDNGWMTYLWGSWLNGYTEDRPFSGMVLYLNDVDNCDNLAKLANGNLNPNANPIVGHIEITFKDDDVNTLKIKYVITESGYALSGVDFSINEPGVGDENWRNYRHSFTNQNEYTFYMTWSGNVSYYEQKINFIQKAKVVTSL